MPPASPMSKALAALKKADPALAKVIARAPKCDLALEKGFEPFDALLSSICHQQLTGKAAQTILGRVRDRVGGGGWPTPLQMKKVKVETLRACGLSGAKAAAVKDLAEKVLDGTVPDAKGLHRLSDEEVIERLVQVRGVGVWTVHMVLMFRLGRTDVLPTGDYGVRKGFARVYGLKDLPSPKVMEAHAERWRPYRSIASWYLWRALELEGP